MMQRKNVPPLAGYFKDVEDLRIDRKKRIPLIEVILIALLAVMSGAEGWEDYGNAKQSWLKRFIPQEIERCFMAWVHDLKMDINREVIAVDGETMRGSVDKHGGCGVAN